MQDRVRIDVAELIEELAPAAALEAADRDVQFTVQPGESDVAVQADRQILAAVVTNLLQNAFKFTRPHQREPERQATPTVCSSRWPTSAAAWPTARSRNYFVLSNNGARDRTGLGLGLAFSRGASRRTAARSPCASAGPRVRLHRGYAEGSHAGDGDGLSAAQGGDERVQVDPKSGPIVLRVHLQGQLDQALLADPRCVMLS